MTPDGAASVEVTDGSFALHLWRPATGSGPGILLLPEIFGVGEFVHSVAARLVALGFVVGAPDVFWRFHPGYTAPHDEAGLQDAMRTVQEHFDFPLAVDDCLAALATLGALPDVRGRPGVVGYSLGGALAWTVAARGAPAACVSYYAPRLPYLLDLAGEVTCPTLLHFADADRFIPPESLAAVRAAISGRPGFTVNVEHAGHSFENHAAAMFHDAAAARSSWQLTVAFLRAHVSRPE